MRWLTEQNRRFIAVLLNRLKLAQPYSKMPVNKSGLRVARGPLNIASF